MLPQRSKYPKAVFMNECCGWRQSPRQLQNSDEGAEERMVTGVELAFVFRPCFLELLITLQR